MDYPYQRVGIIVLLFLFLSQIPHGPHRTKMKSDEPGQQIHLNQIHESFETQQLVVRHLFP